MRDERDRPPAGAMFAKSNDIFDKTPGLLPNAMLAKRATVENIRIRLSVRP